MSASVAVRLYRFWASLVTPDRYVRPTAMLMHRRDNHACPASRVDDGRRRGAQDHIDRALAAGMVDYLVKPYAKQVLLERLGRLLGVALV